MCNCDDINVLWLEFPFIHAFVFYFPETVPTRTIDITNGNDGVKLIINKWREISFCISNSNHDICWSWNLKTIKWCDKILRPCIRMNFYLPSSFWAEATTTGFSSGIEQTTVSVTLGRSTTLNQWNISSHGNYLYLQNWSRAYVVRCLRKASP